MFSRLTLKSFLLLSLITSTKASVTTLFAGDSDIEYWNTDSEFPDSVNKGVGGWTCKQVRNKIGNHLNTYEPDQVVLVCGENDLWGQSVTKTFDDFMKVVDEIVATGARVIYMGTKPEPDTKSLHSKYRSYDAKIRAKAIEMSTASPKRPPPLVMVDVYPIFDAIEDSDPGLLYRNDDLHLSNAGYSYWNTWAQTALADVVGFCIRWKDNICAEESTGGSPTLSPESIPSPKPTPPTPSPQGAPDAILGEVSVNVCPSGYQKIQSEQGCKAAMALIGEDDWKGTEDENNWPSKCYFCNNVQDCTNGVWFNKHGTGQARNGAKPICAVTGWEDNAVCGDDSDWRLTKSNGIEKDCEWVGKKNARARCGKNGDDGRKASEACRFTCLGKGSICGGCVDDNEWKFENPNGRIKKCDWVGKSPTKRCNKVGVDNSVASDACALSCSGNGSNACALSCVENGSGC